MSDAYTVIGDALYEYMEEMDISAAFPEPEEGDPPTWGTKLNRPPKADELTVYPAFAISPARDGQETGDTVTDFDAISYYIYIILSNREANLSEARLRKIVDIVRTNFRELRDDPAPLHDSAYNVTFVGDWGGTPEQGERWYRLEVTVYVHETLVVAIP